MTGEQQGMFWVLALAMFAAAIGVLMCFALRQHSAGALHPGREPL